MAKKESTKEKKEKYSISSTNVIEPKKKINFENEGTKFIVILLCIVAFIGTLWLVNSLKNSENTSEKDTKEDSEVKIDYTEVIVGNMLNQKYGSYLVYAYNKDVEDSNNIEQLLYYKEHVYRLNLDKAYNSVSVAEKSNFKGEISQIKFKGVTLLVIEKGKIKEFYEGSEDIIKYLSK